MYDVSGNSSVSVALLAWYDRHRRALPWRAAPGVAADPYAVWLSEIMLQQTTVAAVKPYFAAFLARWPDVGALAAAPVEAVMQAWAGLGYYSRARNLHACARVVAEKYGGRFPAEEAELRALPGLGPYTAAAVSAIAFGRRAVVVDGNVERVVARLYAIGTPLPGGKASIRARAAELAPAARPGDHAQAMMDLGATICTPKNPACAICPLFGPCAGRAAGDPARLPVKAPRAVRPVRRGAAFYILRADGAVLVRTRPAKGLLGGMTELPGTPWSAGFDPASALPLAPLRARYRKLDGFVAHGFTHFELQLTIYAAGVAAGRPAPDGCRWAAAHALDAEALPSLMRKAIGAARSAGVFHVKQANVVEG
jgi:A/G-specific adenine glycosylase